MSPKKKHRSGSNIIGRVEYSRGKNFVVKVKSQTGGRLDFIRVKWRKRKRREVNSDMGGEQQYEGDVPNRKDEDREKQHEPRIAKLQPTMGKLTTSHGTWGDLIRQANDTTEVLTVVTDRLTD